jgi:DNA-binding NarL/FixJ family response regulator
MSGMVSAPSPAGLRPRRVVVADDTEDIRLMLAIALGRRTDVELVGEASDGQQAIELVAALRPDLLVLDIAMPVLDGLSAAPRIREVSPDTRVVMLTALTGAEYHELAQQAGAVALVEKTTPIGSLVDELLRGADLLGAVLDTLTPSVHQGAAGDPRSPSVARRFVAETLTSWNEAELADVVELLVSELVTNVVVHTAAAPRVTVRLGRDRVHVEVLDTDPRLPTPREADARATSGRGMALVEALSLDWGSTQIVEGKVVWFDVARSQPVAAQPAG